MGLTIILLIGFVLCLILSLILFIVNTVNNNEGLQATGFICSLIFAIGTIIISIESLSILYKYNTQYADKQKTLIDRGILERKLKETYNQDNLNSAIDFNGTQNKIKIENSTFLQKYNTAIFYVDTIQIPDVKFTPTQRIELENIDK